MWDALPDERTGLSFTSASAVILRSESLGTHNQLVCLRFETLPNLKCQVPIFISHTNRVAQLYPQALGSLFVASYDSQGYGGGIGTRLHAGCSPV
jgi:hypothetical protein